MLQRFIVVPHTKLQHQMMGPCKNTKKLVFWGENVAAMPIAIASNMPFIKNNLQVADCQTKFKNKN